MNTIRKTTLALLLSATLSAVADEVAFKVAPEATAVSLTLDAGMDATVLWADGTEKEVHFDGNMQELTLATQSFTITTTGRIHYVVCPGNPITEIDLSGAPYVKGVYADNCLLTAFNPGVGTRLEVLHLSGNAGLKKALQSLSLPGLSFLGVAECGLTKLPSAQDLACLRILWAWNNSLTSAQAVAAPGCEQAYLQNNSLKTISVSPALKTLRVSGNSLTMLNVQRCDSLETLDAADNGLRILSTSPASVASLRHLYLDGNSLVYADMPTLTSADGTFYPGSLVLSPQKAIKIPAELGPEATLDISPHIGRNQWGRELAPEVLWTDRDGNTLAEGVDYITTAPCRYIFVRNREAVKATVTCADYPGMTLTTTEMSIPHAATGISAPDAGKAGLSVFARGNTLTVTTSRTTQVQICSVNGSVWHSFKVNGTWSGQLPAGVYIVNDKKVIIGSDIQ